MKVSDAMAMWGSVSFQPPNSDKILFFGNRLTMDKLVSVDIFIIILLPSIFMVITMMSLVIDRDITRAGVFFAGAALIGVAGYVAWYLMVWQPIAEALVDNKISTRSISKESFQNFQRKSGFVLWIIPFITGSLGTNLISDALTKPLEYKTSSASWLPLRTAKWILTKLFLLAIWFLLILIKAIQCVFSAKQWPRVWRFRAKAYRRHYLSKHAVSKQPWEN